LIEGAKSMLRHAAIRMFFPVFLACLIAAGNQAVSQEGWEKICARVSNVPFPPEDRPAPKDAKALEKCSSYDLYYGFDQPANPEKARLCAYVEMEKVDPGVPFDRPGDGRPMLMTIYANGIGARRNFDVALKLACKVEGAQAEIEGRVQHLENLREKKWQGNNFSLCDDATSGYLAGFCAEHNNRFAATIRADKIARIQAKWAPADKNEYAILRKAADQYFEARSDNEVDQSGTDRAAMVIEEMSLQEEGFISTLEGLEQVTYTKYSNQQFKEADSRLNAVYQQIQKKADFDCGSITKEGIRSTQRLWIKYRDAWIQFCMKKYPSCTPDDIKTYLTLKRIKELEDFLN
jgi:uncharacterized protein YecT (DUF1311 family)